ncbi:MAG: aminotransferase class III-fold pyridoxal phosphate-dependent enzyme [Pseudomonadota bacterium]
MTPLADRDAAVFLHQAGSSPVERAFRGVEGAWAEDDTGHRFLDFAGNTCHNIGYAHPRLIAALTAQLGTLPFTTRGFTNEPAVLLAERLCALWPYGEARVLFGLSGADAIEMAMKIAYIATGRRQSLAFIDSWHGAAFGALSAGGRASEREALPALPGCSHVTPFWPADNQSPSRAETALAELRALLATGAFAFCLAEPIRAPAHRPPDWFWPAVRAACDAAGTLLIFDEVQSGLGKTGRFFASEHFGARPDITVLGKSLGGGALPLSAVIARADLNVTAHLAIGHYTHQKNPLLSRAGLETLAIIEEEGLVARAERVGADLRRALRELCAPRGPFAALRGTGMVTVVETAPGADLPALRRAAFRNGLLAGADRGDGLVLSAPLVIGPDEIAHAVNALRRILQHA